MRILVYEFVSAGGFGTRSIPASLVREGTAMLAALTTDLISLRQHTVVTVVEQDFRSMVTLHHDVQLVSPRPRDLGALFGSVDAVWLVAPEIGGCLERLASKITKCGTALVGSDASAIRRAANKASLAERLAKHGVPHPRTYFVRSQEQLRLATRELGYPFVVKPVRGAGCIGVTRVARPRELEAAVTMVRRTSPAAECVLQAHVPGAAASVSLLADGRRAEVLAVNQQFVRGTRHLSYTGGLTPFQHALASRAAENAVRACEAIEGLKGYVGVDLVLTRSEAVVIEVNPRLTTAYLGVRHAVRDASASRPNVAGLTLNACAGRLGTPPPTVQTVRFYSDGRIHAGGGRTRR